MSAPESGNMFVSHDPFREERWIEIVGAGSVAVTCLMMYIRDGCNSSSMFSCVWIALVDAGCESTVLDDGEGFTGGSKGSMLRLAFRPLPHLALIGWSMRSIELSMPQNLCHDQLEDQV